MVVTPRWLFVGLGNPGERYLHTRHNLGFWTLDAFKALVGAGPWRLRGPMLAAVGDVASHPVALVKPLRWMNLSGGVVASALSSWGASPEQLVVVCDDVALPTGRIRIRSGGSSGGHKGLGSIIGSLGSNRFVRVRIGVGSGRQPEQDLSEFVLQPMADEDVRRCMVICRRAAEEIESCVARGLFASRTLDAGLASELARGATVPAGTVAAV